MKIKAIAAVAITATILTVLGFFTNQVFAAQRKRSYINEERTTFVADNNQPLRGPYTSTEWTPAAYEQIGNIKDLGFNAVHIYAECFDINYPKAGSTAPGYALAEVDKIVEATREHGLYLVITIGNGANNGNYNQKYVEDFWTIYAKRYADETHVLFEVQNEPVAWGPPYSSKYATPTGAVEMEIAAYRIIRKYAPDTPVLLFSYAVPAGKSGANDAMKDIRIFNEAVFGDENAVWTNEAVGFHGYSGWKAASEFVACMIEEGYPCFMTEFAGGTWGSGIGGLDAEMAYELEHLNVSWLTFQYIPPTGVSDNVTIPEHFSAIVENTGLSWEPDYGNWPVLRGAFNTDGLPRKTEEKRIGDTMKGSTRFEAEDFDWGGEGVSYHDTTQANLAGKYRADEPVDIEECTDEGGGYNITSTKEGEWLEYTIWVQNAGYFDLSLRVASENGGSVQISSLNQDKSGSWNLEATGAKQSWTTQSRVIYLDYGIQRLRITFLSDDINLNRIELSPVQEGPFPDGTYKILNRANGLAMRKGVSDDISLIDYSESDYQIWLVRHTGGGQYKLTSKGNWSAVSYKVIIIPIGNGYYRIIDAEKGLSLQATKSDTGFIADKGGFTGAESQQWGFFEPEAPAFPTGLNAALEQSGHVARLTWNSMSDAISYNVKRSTKSGGPYKNIATAITATDFRDTTISSGGKYYYVITAVSSEGESLYSVESNLRLPELTGSIIGTEGSWSNSGNTKHKVFDKDINTFFDSPIGNGSWAGYDFGSNMSKVITQISFCPRSNFPARMISGVFQGANQEDFSDAVTLYTVTSQPVTGAFTTVEVDNTTAFRYVRYLAPNDGYGNVAEIEFHGYSASSTQAGEQTAEPGDIYPDGKIDEIDLIMLKKHIMGIELIQNIKAADLNSDGAIDALDYALMKRYLAGAITAFPAMAMKQTEASSLMQVRVDMWDKNVGSQAVDGIIYGFLPISSTDCIYSLKEYRLGCRFLVHDFINGYNEGLGNLDYEQSLYM